MTPRPASPAYEAGFSLIEAMVALAVLAIATVGLIGAIETHIDSTRGMERRAAAMWVAENRLAELQIGDRAADAPEAAMLDQRWRVVIEHQATDDPAIERVRIAVSPEGESGALATLDGFVATGKDA